MNGLYHLIPILSGIVGAIFTSWLVQEYDNYGKKYSHFSDIFTKRSQCDFCQKKLKFYELMPIFSFILQGGKSRCCNKNLRKKYNKMRLLYSGGTDSHTILKLCIDNDIHIDETITHMVSYIRTPKLDIEYLNGIKFAKSHCPQSIGTVTIIQPQIEDLNFYFKNDWYKDTDIVLYRVLPTSVY